MRFQERKPQNVQAVPKGSKAPPKRKLRLSGSRFPLIVLILFLAFLIFSYGGQLNKLNAMEQDINHIKAQIGDIKDKNEKLREDLDRARSEAHVERVAREELGLIKPGEKLIVPLDYSNPGQSPTSSDSEQIIRD